MKFHRETPEIEARNEETREEVAEALLTPAGDNPRRRPFTFDRVVRIIITIAFVVGAIYLINRLRNVLLPFLVAWLIAYICEPFVQYNRSIFHIRRRFPAIALTLLQATLLILALCVVFVPSIVDEIHQMADMIKNYADSGAHIPLIPESVHEYLRRTIDFRNIADQLTGQDFESIFNAVLSMLSGGFDFLLGIFSWFIVILYVVFIMIDYERLSKGFRRLVPPKYRKIVYGVGRDVQNSMNHYFRGQALVSLCVGVLFAIGFAIIGLPLGVVLGLFIGVLNMVPYLQLISLLPCTLLCIVFAGNTGMSFWQIWAECIAVYLIVQGIQDLFLTPRIMGKYMGLNPAIILLSLSVWGSLLGFIGLIIALPLTTLLLAYYNEYIDKLES